VSDLLAFVVQFLPNCYKPPMEINVMKLVSMGDALSLVREGDEITVSGMSIHRNPMSFIHGLVKSEVRDLRFVDREPGVALEVLLREGIVTKVRAAMASMEWFGIPRYFRMKVEAGEVEFLEDSCGAFIAGLRAGASGVNFSVMRGIIGSDLVRIHDREGTWKVIKDPFTGEEELAVKAIAPDIAVIHVHYADPNGNAEILGPIYEDDLKARAANRVIITAERIVHPDYFKGKRPTISAEHVTAVVESPGGASPTSMFGLYDTDYEALADLEYG